MVSTAQRPTRTGVARDWKFWLALLVVLGLLWLSLVTGVADLSDAQGEQFLEIGRAHV